MKSIRRQIFASKRVREKGLDIRMRWGFWSVDVHQDQFCFGSIFGNNLPACATWGCPAFGGNGQLIKREVAGCEGFENGDPFGATAEPVTGALDIGAMNDGARVGEECCAHFEFGIRRLREFACFHGFGYDVGGVIHNGVQIR